MNQVNGSDLDDFQRQAGGDAFDGVVTDEHLLADWQRCRHHQATAGQCDGDDAGADAHHGARLQRRGGDQLAELLVEVMHGLHPSVCQTSSILASTCVERTSPSRDAAVLVLDNAPAR